MNDWFEALRACTVCGSHQLGDAPAALICGECGARFPLIDGIVDFVAGDSRRGPTPRLYDNPFYKQFMAGLQDLHAAHYAPESFSGKLEAAMKRDLFRLVEPSDAPSVDLGCGMGEGFRHFGPSDRVIGVDFELPLLRIARQRHPETRLLRAKLERLPFRSASLKQVFAIFVLEHVFHLERTLEEIQRCLASDGRLYVLVPTEGNLPVAVARLVTSARNAKLIGLTPPQSRIAQRIDHCNSVALVEDSLRKFFRIERTLCWPFRIGGRPLNLAKSYRLSGFQF